jgi:hypothetical protein
VGDGVEKLKVVKMDVSVDELTLINDDSYNSSG